MYKPDIHWSTWNLYWYRLKKCGKLWAKGMTGMLTFVFFGDVDVLWFMQTCSVWNVNMMRGGDDELYLKMMHSNEYGIFLYCKYCASFYDWTNAKTVPGYAALLWQKAMYGGWGGIEVGCGWSGMNVGCWWGVDGLGWMLGVGVEWQETRSKL